jgi:TonB family protein
MRRMILTSLVLLPVMAHAHASTSTEPRPSTSSASPEAELIQPAVPAELAMKAAAAKAAAAPAASTAAIGTSNHAGIRESIQTRLLTDDFAEAALHMGGTLEYSFKGSVPTQSSAPQVTRAVEVDLSDRELAEQPAVSRVVLRAIVDENGVPRNVAVSQSAGSVVDRKAIAAVSQDRFKPATLDNKPTWASVSITIEIQKH